MFKERVSRTEIAPFIKFGFFSVEKGQHDTKFRILRGVDPQLAKKEVIALMERLAPKN